MLWRYADGAINTALNGGRSMSEIVCEGCGAVTAGYDTVNYGAIDVGYRVLCSRCFNREVATRAGLDKFEHVRLEPVKLSDCTE